MTGVVTGGTVGHPRLTAQRRLWRWFWRALIVAGIGFGAYVIEGNAGELVLAGEDLTNLRYGWLVVAAVLELASYLTFSLSQSRLLSVGGARPGVVAVMEQALSAQAVANCLPAGAAAQLVFSYRAFRRMKVDEALSAWVIAVNNVLYIGALAVIALVAVETAGKATRQSGLPNPQPYAIGVLAGLAAIMAVAVLLHRRNLLVRWLDAAVRRTGLMGRHPSGASAAETILARFTAFSPSRSDLGACSLLLLLSWLTDAACFALSFPVLGLTVPVRGLLFAYAAGQLASALPITPGGLVVVEGSLTVALVAYGGGSDASYLAPVLLYRILSYWAIMPAGLVTYGLLRRRRPLPVDDPDVATDEVAV